MADFNSKYRGTVVEQLLDQVANGEVGGGETLTEADIANMGFTKNQGTITEVKMNGESKGSSGVVDLGNVLTEHQELMWIKEEGEAGVRLKGTNGTATGNQAISAGDDKTASDGTLFKSTASGDHAVAFGFGNTCSGRTTLAQGLYNSVTGKDSVAFGQRNTVNGDQAFAAGQQNEVSTRLGVAIGYQNKSTNTNSIAIGYKNTSSGSGSVALGDTCESSGTSSTAMGYKTKASGAYSATFGENTQATNNGEVAMGSYNKSTTSTDTSEQTSFSFGIGTSDTDRLNAFEIKKNGDVYVGDTLLNEKMSAVDDKQDVIEDLEAIRSGAAKGATALQSVPSEYVTETELAAKKYATTTDVAKKYDTSGGTITGNVICKNGYFKSEKSSITVFHDMAHIFKSAMSNVGTIVIKIWKANQFMQLDFCISGYRLLWDLKLSGYTYTDSTSFHSPLAMGLFRGIEPKLRAAVDEEGNRCFLLGDTTTEWGGYIRASVYKYLCQSSGGSEDKNPNITLSLVTDESAFTSIKEIPINDMNVNSYLKYIEQDLTEEEKEIACDNIGAVKHVEGKNLSTEDFTSFLKEKLESLNNYDDTAINTAISTLRRDLDNLISGDTTTAIKTFNEIIAFLDGVQDTQSLNGIIASIEQQIAGKMDKVTLATVATSGSYNDLSDKPTIPDVSNKVDKVSGKGLSTNDYTTAEKDKLAGIASGAEVNVQSDWNVTDSTSNAFIKNKPTIPSTVTESTVSGWGFTKNTGTYSKPSGGIPKTDLASAVQTSLGKADTALQSYTEQYKGTVTGVKVNGSTKSPSSGTVDIGNVVTSVKVNGSTYSPSSGVVDLGTISGEGSSGGGGKEVVYRALFFSEDDPMQPNKIYINNTYTLMAINILALEQISDYDVYTAIFSWPEVGLYLPDDVLFANGQSFDIEYDTLCELSIVGTNIFGERVYNAVITPFKPV